MPKGQYTRPPVADLTSSRFHRWIVIGRSDRRSKKGVVYWLCRCDCGTEREVQVSSLTSERSKSCGCWSAELTAARQTTHGGSSSLEFGVWNAMWQRCTNPKNKRFDHYGGRGIRVCKRWEHFDLFLKDMGQRPSPRHSIDRIDNDKGYNPRNCRWATPTEQNRNTSRNTVITYAGQTLTLAEWAEETGLSYTALYTRLHRLQWTIEKALTTPHRTRSERLPST